MVDSARLLDAVSSSSSEQQGRRWEEIQEAMGDLPPGSLRDFVVEFVRSLVVDRSATQEVIDDWHRRARSARSQARYPHANAVKSVEDWHKLPDRTLP